MARLTGKVAIITGTGAGMGRAAALRFAAEGTTVVGCELNPQTSAETVRLVHEAGGTMTSTAPVDLSSFEATPSRCRRRGAPHSSQRDPDRPDPHAVDRVPDLVARRPGQHARCNAATIPVDGGQSVIEEVRRDADSPRTAADGDLPHWQPPESQPGSATDNAY